MTARWIGALALAPLWLAGVVTRRLGRLGIRGAKLGALLALATLLGTSLVVRSAPYPIDRLSPDRGGPLVLLDRNGEVLHRRASPDGRPGRTGWVRLDDISSHAVLTVIGVVIMMFVIAPLLASAALVAVPATLWLIRYIGSFQVIEELFKFLFAALRFRGNELIVVDQTLWFLVRRRRRKMAAASGQNRPG